MTARTASLLGSDVGGLQFGERVREVKSKIFETANTVDAGDTMTITLASEGITTVQAQQGFKHTTDNSVIVSENPTTQVLSSGTMEFTFPAGTDNDKRIVQIFYT